MASGQKTVQSQSREDSEIDTVGMGHRIQELRRSKNLTQKQMAKDLEISYQYISMIENGAKQMSLSMLVAVANYLGTTTDYLLTGQINKKEELPGAADYMDIIAGLKPAEKEVVLKVAKAAKEALRSEKAKNRA